MESIPRAYRSSGLYALGKTPFMKVGPGIWANFESIPLRKMSKSQLHIKTNGTHVL